MSKPTFRTIADYRAVCEGCGWAAYSRNAMGLAAKHYDRCGSYLRVEVERAYVWDPDREARKEDPE